MIWVLRTLMVAVVLGLGLLVWEPESTTTVAPKLVSTPTVQELPWICGYSVR